VVITIACRGASRSNRGTNTRAVTVATALTTFLWHLGLSESNCSVAVRASGALALFALALLTALALAFAGFAATLRDRGPLQVVVRVLQHKGMPGAPCDRPIRTKGHVPMSWLLILFLVRRSRRCIRIAVGGFE